MFTGIISASAKITHVTTTGKGLTITITKPKGFSIKKGDSISVNGVCSTVTNISPGISFWYMPETLAKSNLGELSVGSVVNLEQSIKPTERLDGHIVLGHVDTVGKISNITPEGSSKIFTIELKIPHEGLLAPKGSVTVEGISLTTVIVKKNTFTIHSIPYTLEHTNLHSKRVGDTVNIEYDVIAKYVQSLLKK